MTPFKAGISFLHKTDKGYDTDLVFAT